MTLILSYVIFTEIRIHYFLEFNGSVVGKERQLPKKLPEILVAGTDESFHARKWEGINFDAVQVGDSIVKRKYEPGASWYRKKQNGTFELVKLRYWIF
ncbi:hypothetical protein D3C87_1953800 [compost metagenome]